MGGQITKLDVPIPFPVEIYRRIDKAEFQDRVRFLNETIYEITELFDGDTDAVTWHKKKLEHFQIILHRQFVNLKTCVSPAIQPEENLKRHFQELNLKILKEMNYSAPAWELIRKETRHHLHRLHFLARKH